MRLRDGFTASLPYASRVCPANDVFQPGVSCARSLIFQSRSIEGQSSYENVWVQSLLAGIGSTIALVVWGMIFWGWVHEFFGIFNKLPGDTEVVELLIANGTTTGTYFFPWPRNTPETFADFVQQHQRGPFFQLSYIEEGVDPQAPTKILRGVFQYFIVSMIAVALVRLTMTASTSFWRKFSVIFLAGLMGTIFIRLSDPIWFHLPWPHTIGNVVFEIVSWLLMGAVIAAILKQGKVNG